jgi:hypothetical protein
MGFAAQVICPKLLTTAGREAKRGWAGRDMKRRAEADEFMGSFGQNAYQEARYELAKAFERGDKARIKFLERVCKAIASEPHLKKNALRI